MTTDSTKLRQILKNLLSNAFKFTERGRIDLTISRADRSDEVDLGGDMISFVVADTGIGIAPDKRELIFEAFTQADQGTARRFGGTGLGLSIARNWATRLGGSITATSEVGVGSTFRLTLPLGVSPAAEPSPIPEPLTAPLATTSGLDSLAGKTILVVDSDMRSLYSVSNLLAYWQVRVLTAPDAPAMEVEVGRASELDAVVMSVSLATSDRATILRCLEALPNHVPVIGLRNAGETISTDVGIVVELVRPVTPSTLQSVLLQACLRPPTTA